MKDEKQVYLRAMRRPIPFTALCILLAGLTLFLGYFARRADFWSLFLSYSAFFGMYAWTLFCTQPPTLEDGKKLVWLGILLRAMLLFSIPNLSDDYARFLWDGQLTVSGIHPFAHPPSYFTSQPVFSTGTLSVLYERLNSPGYFTVYPPVCQLVFAVAAWAFPHSIWGGVVLMKSFLLATEVGTLWLLEKMRGQKWALVYALNPLVVLEICGNCHFEGAMIFFLMAGLYAFRQDKVFRAAVWWALATASKMLPILFLPVVWRWLGWGRGWKFVLVFSAACLVLFAPILVVVPNMLESLDLYFRQFQFNASVYYLVRAVGYYKIGWDIGEFSGPALGLLTLLSIFLLSLFTQKKGTWPKDKKGLVFESALLFSLMIYLSLAATVQPWYATVPLAISLLGPWRFTVLWSYLVVLSYSHYQGGGLQENYTWIGTEYVLLWAFFVWEMRPSNLQKAA